MKIKYASVALLALLSASVNAASFDCNLPSLSRTEKAICKIPELSDLDSRMHQVYDLIKNVEGVKADQRAFIKERNTITSLPKLKEIMRDRATEMEVIAELEGIQIPETVQVAAEVTKALVAEKAPAPKVKAAAKKPKSDVIDIIEQLKTGDTLTYKGATAYADYLRDDAPAWVLNCARVITRNDIMGAWTKEARKAGVIREFKEVEQKARIGFTNLTIDNLMKDVYKAQMYCDIMNAMG